MAGTAAAITGSDMRGRLGPLLGGSDCRIEFPTPALGVEITGLDLGEVARNAALVAELRALWLERKVLFFRQESISPPELQAFAACFGTLEPHPAAPMHPDAPLLFPIYRGGEGQPNAVEKVSRENIWHNDLTYTPVPPRGAVLACEACPETGGDTMWANMALAYERLPEQVRARIAGLYAKHSLEQYFGAQLPQEKRLKLARRLPPIEHPVVVTHPETGEQALFVNQPFTTHFANFFSFTDVRYGQDFQEAGALLDFLKAQAQQPEFQVRLKWQPGTIALWDNLLTQHYAVSDYGNAPRRMLRATLRGEPLS